MSDFDFHVLKENIKYNYFTENPDAQKIKIKIIKAGDFHWYNNHIGEEFEIWDKPDKQHSEWFGNNAYYIASGDMEWIGLVEKGNFEFV